MHAQALQLDLPEPQRRKRCAGAVALAHVLTAPRVRRAKQPANLPVEPAPAPIQPELELPAPPHRALRSAAAILAEHQALDEAGPVAELIIPPAAPMPDGAELDLALGDPDLANCEPIPPHQEYAGLYVEPRADQRPPYWVDL